MRQTKDLTAIFVNYSKNIVKSDLVTFLVGLENEQLLSMAAKPKKTTDSNKEMQ